MPPWPGTRALNSANTRAPSAASSPPIPHADNISAGEPVLLATLAGVKKMPTPMMPPIATQAMSNTPSPRRSGPLRTGSGRASSGSGGGEAIEVLGEIDDHGVEREI